MYSFLQPGFGQLHNGQIGKGVATLVAFTGAAYIFKSGLLSTRFWGAVALFVTLVGIRLWATANAFRIARLCEGGLRHWWQRWYTLVPLLIAFGLAVEEGLSRTSGLETIYIPSQAMSPTLILGDRVAVDARHYRNRKPRRGDIVRLRSPDRSRIGMTISSGEELGR